MKAYLSLGSNLGDRREFIRRGIAAVASFPDTAVVAESPWFETAPRETGDQPDFINLVLKIETSLGPEALLEACLSAERALGRRRGRDRGPREIDIDIVFYGTQVRTSPPILPHPRYRARRFVLEPLQRLDPGLTDPVTGEAVGELLGEVSEQAVRELAGSGKGR
ncbi:MAG TPA: 2-amino-4-hydroxy-6-hydroxymethyldihydropteridine diphosphokinase [bacterium]|nr:2-amino-4-hydroxy-6-hydroxymethyldihydropteridine diphosphokinase [bacterium]HPJ72199.1 2-amino-4-hydroxy-6-hydroxymethyldihydropteridine diphosphokinase [bacterium]HPQ66629.1 2-amino-4-hydroxy-6-hydroxymethyldihydropteridine diphosphokinase [bacterium]